MENILNVRFHTKVQKSNLSCFTDCTKHASAGALTDSWTTDNLLGFTETKLSSIYRYKRIGP